MKPSLHSPTYNKWLQMLGTLTVSGGLTLTALAVNPGTSNPGGKTNGEAQEKIRRRRAALPGGWQGL